MRVFGFPYTIENTKVFSCLTLGQSDKRGYHINNLRTPAYSLFTCFPHKMWKTARLLSLLLTILCLAGPIGCSTSKQHSKPEQRISSADNNLVSYGPEVVTKKLGEPTTVSKTPEGHILWIYEPSWKILPNDKGTVYVEFEDNKVTKVFKIK
jgi:hypothetical protein